MLFLRTGLPGAGKTLNTIKEIDEEHAVDPNDPTKRLHPDPHDSDAPPRTIYYYGIPELKVDRLKAKWVEFDTPEEWFKQPDGSVIVIDEAQRVFGADGTRARPEKVARFETHRHHGLDIHLITQHPSLLMTHVRKLVGKHINMIRPFGRDKGLFRHEYEFCIDSPEKRSNFKQAQEEKISLDPAYFGVYRSATVHTHKKVTPSYVKMIPLYVVATLLPILLLVVGGYYFINLVDDEKDQLRIHSASVEAKTESLAVATGSHVKAAAKAPGKASSGAVSAEQYVEEHKPRIADVAASAPVYDELTKPRDFPRPVCALSEDPRMISNARNRGQPVGEVNGREYTCQCYTQQVTRMDTTAEFCRDVVLNGVFDDTRLKPTYASGNSRGLTSSSSEPAALQRGRAAATQPAASVSREPVVVTDSDYASKPWR